MWLAMVWLGDPPNSSPIAALVPRCIRSIRVAAVAEHLVVGAAHDDLVLEAEVRGLVFDDDVRVDAGHAPRRSWWSGRIPEPSYRFQRWRCRPRRCAGRFCRRGCGASGSASAASILLKRLARSRMKRQLGDLVAGDPAVVHERRLKDGRVEREPVLVGKDVVTPRM